MISAIVTIYNIEKYINRCVQSLMEQTYSDIEIILVDDGSTDDSGKICDDLASEDPRIVVIHKTNGGNANARNAGIDVSKGEFITFVDGDDYLEKDAFEEMLAEMADEDTSIVCCGMIITDVEGNDSVQTSKERLVLSREQAMLDFFTRAGNVKPSACNKLFRREIFDNGLRFRNEVIHEDTEAMPRFLNQAKSVVVVNKAFYHYVRRNNSARTSRFFNMRGYHILDSMSEYENMCKSDYREILPTFYYYELLTTYEMYIDLNTCVDRRKYIKQDFTLRGRVLRSILKCMRFETIREENRSQMLIMLVKVVLGIKFSRLILE